MLQTVRVPLGHRKWLGSSSLSQSDTFVLDRRFFSGLLCNSRTIIPLRRIVSCDGLVTAEDKHPTKVLAVNRRPFYMRPPPPRSIGGLFCTWSSSSSSPWAGLGRVVTCQWWRWWVELWVLASVCRCPAGEEGRAVVTGSVFHGIWWWPMGVSIVCRWGRDQVIGVMMLVCISSPGCWGYCLIINIIGIIAWESDSVD